MMLPFIVLLYLMSFSLISALSPATRPADTPTTLSPCTTTASSMPSPTITIAPTTQVVFQPVTSAVITLPPNEFEKHDPRRKRQECFNDQGFSVDCATWTGYYYTWGPAGNPYEGGPGEGGGGGGGATIINYAGGANAVEAYSFAGLLLGFVAFFL